MNAPAAPFPGSEAHDAADDAACAHDLARGLIEPQLAMLQELAEIGMTLARGLGHEPEEAPAENNALKQRSDSANNPDPILAFDRVSRAVRYTLALQSRLVADLGALEDGRVPPRPHAARKQAVQHIVGGVARTQHRLSGPHGVADILERLLPEASERLDDESSTATS